MTSRSAYLDVSAGVAGDMLLAALVDAGADLGAAQGAVDAVIPDSVRLTSHRVDRAGQAARKVDVEILVDDPPHRRWTEIRALLTEAAELPARTRELALDAFGRLAAAEAAAHGVEAEDVHFHEVGALDAIADIVGTCDAVRQLGITEATASPVAVGSGRVSTQHGDMPVPVPAVVRLALGFPTVAGDVLPGVTHTHRRDHEHGGPHEHGQLHEHGDAEVAASALGHGHAGAEDTRPHDLGELATPTGVALVRALAARAGAQPPLTVEAVGAGAGAKDTPGRPNVVRVLVGTPSGDATPVDAVELAANVDDLEPRLWPGVLESLLEEGALDAWLVPILMKKGRPGHTVQVLSGPDDVDRLTAVLLRETTTFGVRSHPVGRTVLTRSWVDVTITGRTVRVKVGRDASGIIVTVQPEFDDAAAAARTAGVPVGRVLDRAREQARAALA